MYRGHRLYLFEGIGAGGGEGCRGWSREMRLEGSSISNEILSYWIVPISKKPTPDPGRMSNSRVEYIWMGYR